VRRRRIGAPGTRRRRIRRAAVVLPSGFTLANLFFGVFSIVAASRGDLQQAVLYIVLGGIADALDGRVARATGSGTALGEELDSLVDVISFGLAPSMLVYFAVLNRGGWDWVFSFAFTAAAALRLARFNVTQAGTAKRYFHGLPSPAAGLTLATYYWFSQTPLYNETNIVNLPWHVLLRWLMLGLGALMVSEVSYPAVPTVGIRSLREIGGLVAVLATLVGVFFVPKEFFFPAAIAYVLWGVARLVFFGLIGRREVADDVLLAEAEAHMSDRDDYEPARERLHEREHAHERSHETVSTLPLEAPAFATDEAALSDPARRKRRRRRRRPTDRGPRGGSDEGDGTPPPPTP
jgi:CDP-diacylglycerol--serine O-phosphatidyltransferase